MPAPKSLVSVFLESAEKFPDRPALQIQEEAYSYEKLRTLSCAVAATLKSLPAAESPLTGVFGHRSFAAFSGIIATLLSGDAYVPLNPSFPTERTLQMIKRVRLGKIVAEQDSLEQLTAVLSQLDEAVTVLLIDADTLPELPSACAHHTFMTASDLADSTAFTASTACNTDLAYILFTSGSTGQPKGVMVTQENVTSFVDYMVQRYKITEQDRFSQTFDLTFDLSAFDMFVAWSKGACVCCPTQGEKLLPAKYIQSQNISIWFSVPSTAVMMKKLRMLKPNNYPSLRYSLFCGEALPLEIAEAFQQAAPNSIVENLYGPTELTIACTVYQYDSATSADEAEQGVVPIGRPYPAMEVLIADEKFCPVKEGEPGELLMTGNQLTLGYWEDTDKTASAFVVPPGETKTFYRTGDRVRRNSADGPLLYLGRMDNQIKVQGYRVELGEIEALIRNAGELDVAIAIGYPTGASGAEGIIAFRSESPIDDADILADLASKLPAYMQPRRLITIGTFPLNANGKVDRKALLNEYLVDN